MARISIETTGCSMNGSDTEFMMGLLQKEGHTFVSSEEAELVILNGCNVKAPSQQKYFKRIEQLKNKKIILAGCVPQSLPEKVSEFSAIGTYQLNRISEVVERTLQGETIRHLEKKHTNRLTLPKIRRQEIIDIIPINSGCLGACAFCVTKKARGVLHSYDREEIIHSMRKALQENIKEFWLTSQDTAVWGLDKRENIIRLLKDILNLDGDFKIRLGMGNPDHFKEYANELIKIFEHEKMFQFLHIPLQSGNNRILKVMKRGYTVEEYIEIVQKIKKVFPKITIATDIICGFPTETEEEFQDTIKIIKLLKPEIINISRFWARPGTEAEKMQQVSPKEIKRRTKILMDLFKKMSLEQHKSWIGWKGEVLIDSYEDRQYIGRNFAYQKIILQGNFKVGEKVDIEIVNASTFHLEGKRIENTLKII